MVQLRELAVGQRAYEHNQEDVGDVLRWVLKI